MKNTPTADDPRHYTTKDGRTMPVSGTHDTDACTYIAENGDRCGVQRQYHSAIHTPYITLHPHPFASPCTTCQLTPLRQPADAFPVGRLVRWEYGRRGYAHGRVLEQGRTRVRVWWHRSGKRGRAFTISTKRLELVPEATLGACYECEHGR